MADKKKTLSEKISELINPNPVWEDPETEYSETTAKVVDNSGEYLDDEVLPSSLKLSQCALLDEDDEKYLGKKVSRKKFENGSSILGDLSKEIEESEISEDESTGSLGSELSSDEAVSEDEESELECNAAGSDDASLVEQVSKISDINQCLQVDDGLFKHLITNDLSAELEKGNAVRSQIRLWDHLLEVRIQLQKCLVAANRLPHHDSFHSFKKLGESEFQTQLNLCKKGGLGLLEKLMEFQRKLLQSYPETKNLCSRKSRNADADDEIISTDEEGDDSTNLNVDEVPAKRRKLNEYSEVISQQHNDFKKFRNDTLEKWYNRSKVSVSGTKSSNFSAFDMSVLKQIDHVLCDKNLIKRTQKKRSSYRVLGNPDITEAEKVNEAKNEEEFDKEIYDDDDFYHKLLRELIERKAADVADPVQLERQWTELQKLRRKLKKKVDTKASKGRKIRYVVHSKLVNFMAPIPNNWSDSAMDDLFRSLFGKTE